MQEQKNNRNQWIHVRLTQGEYDLFQEHFKGTTEKSFSAYIRKMMLAKPMIKGYRNESLNETNATLFELRKDLNGIANNLNQVVHKLHTLECEPEIKGWLMSFELSKKSTFKSIEEIRAFISKTAEKWLQS